MTRWSVRRSTPADDSWCARPASGSDTQLAQMARLVEEAQSGKADVQRLADRISGIFVPIVLVIAVVTLVAWLLLGADPAAAFTAAVAVLIIACPCALGLATPTALLVGTGRGAQLGILIRGPEVLESTRRVDTIVLDKTGTVTSGRMELVEVVSATAARAEVLRLAGALEHASEHPIARAIAQAAEAETGALPQVESFQNLPGLGVSGIVDGHAVIVGRPALLAEWALELPVDLAEAADAAETAGRTAVRRRLGRCRARGARGGRHRQADQPRGDRPAEAPGARPGAADRRQRPSRPLRWPPRSGSTGCTPGFSPPTRSP